MQLVLLAPFTYPLKKAHTVERFSPLDITPSRSASLTMRLVPEEISFSGSPITLTYLRLPW